MRLGAGRYNCKEYSGFPYSCNECKEFFVGNYKNEDLSCPTCQSKNIILYNDPQFQIIKEEEPIKELLFWSKFFGKKDVTPTNKSAKVFSWTMEKESIKETSFFVLTDECYKCPKCNQFSMKFDCIALSD